MKPHKWAKEIKAWADGADVQFRFSPDGKWQDYDPEWKEEATPSWTQEGLEFRVKPEKKEPGEVMCAQMWPGAVWCEFTEEGRREYNRYAQAVINAYKAGEIE